ncbi:MAG TPA: DUF2950 domain-containing protein [Gemmatimonadales bacterium]|nr:DUF2950 domain-containing protein [Gemmatimonadales bacterium]
MSSAPLHFVRQLGAAAGLVALLGGCGDTRGSASSAEAAPPEDTTPPRQFASPESAAAALIAAAEKFDVAELKAILGGGGADLVETEDTVQDRQTATAFAAEARKKQRIELDSTKTTAVLSVGPSDWPAPIPIVQHEGKWVFDAAAGREEVLRRRIGRNELDAIQVCLGYVEAQKEYALARHDGALVNQYAQRVISSPGKQDGLAWRTPDGKWAGPVGEEIARAIGEGYKDKYEPYHGYYFKILKGQGPAAPLGQMDFVVDGAMIGGFALVAAPAEYLVTGVNTFIVSHDGIVYEKDLGEQTLEAFRKMERYNPDSTWRAVRDM